MDSEFPRRFCTQIQILKRCVLATDSTPKEALSNYIPEVRLPKYITFYFSALSFDI